VPCRVGGDSRRGYRAPSPEGADAPPLHGLEEGGVDYWIGCGTVLRGGRKGRGEYRNRKEEQAPAHVILQGDGHLTKGTGKVGVGSWSGQRKRCPIQGFGRPSRRRDFRIGRGTLE
jgi:hypothetical protein